MAQAIVTVLILLIFVVYAVFFALWNPGTISVVSLYLTEGMSWGGAIPLFILPLAGVAVGAIVMAIAISAPWSSLKSKLICAEEQVEAARERSKDCEEKVKELRSRLQKMEAQKRAGSAAAGAAESPPSETTASDGDA